MTRIEIVIDELVLHGADPRQRHIIGDAVAAQLGALDPAVLRALVPSPAARSDLTLGDVRAGAAVPLSDVGRSIVSAVSHAAGHTPPTTPRS